MSEREEAPQGQSDDSIFDSLVTQMDDDEPVQPEAEADEPDAEDDEPAEEVAEQPEDEPTQPEQDDEPDGDVEATTEEPHDDLNERLRRAVETFENAANRLRNNPTPQNERAAAKAKSKLESLMDSDEADIDAPRALKDVASEVHDYKRQSGETLSQYEQRIQSMGHQLAQLSEQVYRQSLESEHPELKGKYDSIKKAALERVHNIIGDDPVPERVWERAWSSAWNTEFQAALGSAKPPSPPKAAASPTPKPKATQPIKSKAGNASKPPENSTQSREAALSMLVKEVD